MIILIILAGVALFALIVGPQFWIKWVMAKHAVERTDFPGTGAELARHLLKEAGVEDVRVEITEAGDHYSPAEKMVRLSKANYEGMSVTAAAVAAHEVGHALQDRDGYLPLHLRQRLVGYAVTIERVGIGPAGEQGLHLGIRNGRQRGTHDVQRRLAQPVGGVGIGLALEQPAHGFGVADERRVVEQRVAVAITGRDV